MQYLHLSGGYEQRTAAATAYANSQGTVKVVVLHPVQHVVLQLLSVRHTQNDESQGMPCAQAAAPIINAKNKVNQTFIVLLSKFGLSSALSKLLTLNI